MESIIHTLFFFIIAIGILVAFHEYGHFWVARKVGVKVLRFSIGFGKVICSYQKTPSETEFVLSAIPLGGYVKMVDEREGPVAAEDLPYAFNRQPLWARSAVVLAGPVFNLMLALILYWAVFMLGETGIRPVIGPIESGTLAAAAGFEEGEEILAVNDTVTPTWSEALGAIFSSALSNNREILVAVENADGQEYQRNLQIPEDAPQGPEQLYKTLGFVPWQPLLSPVIGIVLPDHAAAKAGLLAGDRIISAQGQDIESWRQWVKFVRDRAGQEIEVLLEREGVQFTLPVTLGTKETEEGTVGWIGASVEVPQELLDSMQVTYSLSPGEALVAAAKRTWLYSTATLKMIGSMLVGDASVENLSGPISIAQYAGQSASMGLVQFLKYLAIVSISLGVLNLLPIPVLDGGHLMFFFIEAIKGSPVSEQAQIVFQNIGMLLLFSLMGLAMFVDLGRVFS